MDQPDFPARWKVSDPVLIAETFSSRIWKVRLGDGKPAIVKDLKPFDDVEDELRGAHFLAWRNGEGAVRLLGFDGNRMLLEYAGERHLLDDLNTYGDSAATEIAAEAMARLFAPSDRPVPVICSRFASVSPACSSGRRPIARQARKAFTSRPPE